MNISKVAVKVECHDDFHIDNGIDENSETGSITSKYSWNYSGAKIFKCDECDYASAHRAGLKAHKRKHYGDLFQYDQCDYKANQLGNLKRHKRIHTGEKPFKCQYCDKAYAAICGLRKHQQKIHSNLTLE